MPVLLRQNQQIVGGLLEALERHELAPVEEVDEQAAETDLHVRAPPESHGCGFFTDQIDQGLRGLIDIISRIISVTSFSQHIPEWQYNRVDAREEAAAVGFWRSTHMQNRLRGLLVDFLDRRDLVPFKRLEKTAGDMLILAKENRHRL